ncbi:glycerophosphodiester phosphodiesterase family protein [Arenibaculum sp.]|uniref:glycerophosphodiester phosphodiesterase family protein n=1 Tax=Arenibaculum sp. TaxID=2865862 RepID=UPI002E101232|nr:glycerophosphodiester phosphodiesterase family protein [Arenibaculum sp.]
MARPWFLERPIAHRGLHNVYEGVIEHSRESILRALRADLPIEVDLVSSADQVNFVIHDFVLDHLTDGKGDIRALDAATVRACRLNFTEDERIMTLDELLELVDGRVPLMVEIKSRLVRIIPSVQEACRRLDRYDGIFSVQSFNPVVMEWVAEHYPHFTKGLLTYDTDMLEGRNHYILALLRNRMRPDFVAHHLRAQNSWTFQWMLEQDVPRLAFTVRNHAEWDEARAFADNMFFEYVEPDRADWRVPARIPWRADAGEGTDRRDLHNPPARPDRQLNETDPWWRF